MSLLFLECERDAYAARFVNNARQRREFEWQIVTEAFDYLRMPRQTRDPDMVREMYEAVGEFREIGDLPVVKTARAIFAATVLEILGEERLRPEDAAYRPEAVAEAFHTAIRVGIAAFDARFDAEDPARERMLGLAPGVKDRVAWQAYMAWRSDGLSNAVRAFPEPAFGSEKIPSRHLAFLPVEGNLMNELWAGLLPSDPNRDWAAFALEMAESASETDTGAPSGFIPAEVSARLSIDGLRAYEPPIGKMGDVAEINPLSIKGRMEGVDTPVALMEIPHLPRGCAANGPNCTVRLWDWCPWRDCVAAEAWISLENDVTIYAVVPYYCEDKFLIDRGLPCSAQLAFFATEAKIDTIDGASREIGGADGKPCVMERDFTYLVFASKNNWLSRAWYASRAMVEGVRTAKMWNGENVLRLEVRMRDIPFLVPTYVHSSKFADGEPKVGDAVMMIGWFHLDLRETLMLFEEYDRQYPEGLSVPKDKVPGSIGASGGT